jgi:hypothetical protein
MAVYYSEAAATPASDVHGAMDQVDNSTATTISVLNQWEEVANFSAGLLDNFTFASNALTCGLDGDFEVNWSCSAIAASANTTFEFAISINDTIETDTVIQRKFSTNTDAGAMACVQLKNLSADDVLKFEVRNVTDTTNITIKYCNVVAHRIS